MISHFRLNFVKWGETMKLKRWFKKIIAVLVLISGVGFGAVLLINHYVKSSVEERILTESEAALLDVDCILILGAGVWQNAKPSPMLEDRLLQGIALYQEGASDRLLMSGDHGRKEYDEVNVMKGFAMERNVDSKHIFMDHAGFNTYDSLYRAKEIFQAKKIIIVTQKYHMYRALYIAEKLGLDAYGVPSNPRDYAGQKARDIREKIARTKDFLNVVVKPEPTYLGEVIPVSGDGDLTND